MRLGAHYCLHLTALQRLQSFSLVPGPASEEQFAHCVLFTGAAVDEDEGSCARGVCVYEYVRTCVYVEVKLARG
jgi:hypothetical protein